MRTAEASQLAYSSWTPEVKQPVHRWIYELVKAKPRTHGELAELYRQRNHHLTIVQAANTMNGRLAELRPCIKAGDVSDHGQGVLKVYADFQVDKMSEESMFKTKINGLMKAWLKNPAGVTMEDKAKMLDEIRTFWCERKKISAENWNEIRKKYKKPGWGPSRRP